MDCPQGTNPGRRTFFVLSSLPSISRDDQKALYLPNITGKSLDEGRQKSTTLMCFGRITVLAMLGTKISEVLSRIYLYFLC